MFGLFRKHKKQDEPVVSILVIEDSEADRVLIQRTSEKKTYSVILANDGESGLRLIREHKIDLIILDYFLPGMNGAEICQILKADKETQYIPVIFLTVVESGEKILECYGSGGESYIHKPINAKDLLREVRTILLEPREHYFEGN